MNFLNLFRRLRHSSSRSASARRFRPYLEGLESRFVPYNVSGNVWPNPQLITLSFVPDGTNLGGKVSNLFSVFNSRFGSPTVWESQILKAAQAWAQQTDINFAVVADSGAAQGSGGFQQGDPTMGDIRIGGYNFGTTTLASAFMPPPVNNYSVAGDVQFNTGQAFNIGTTYDLFTVAVHEIGHALGLYHSNLLSADMYSAYLGVKGGLTADDISGIRNIYSSNNPRANDVYGAGNNSFGTASNITGAIDPTSLTEQLNGLDIATAGQKEYFQVTAPAGTGSTVAVSVQSQGLSLLAPTVTVYAADQVTVLGSASGAGQYGTTLTVNLANKVGAGQVMYIKVGGADNTALGTGNYALTLSFAGAPLPAVAPPSTQTPNGTPLSGGGGLGLAQALPYQVNTDTSNVNLTFAESPQAVAISATGAYVVTWSGQSPNGGGWNVYARQFDAFGVPQGGQFQVNAATGSDQMYSTVALDANGNFVITWSGRNPNSGGWNVYARRYNANGTPQGNQFQVNGTTAGDQMYSTVAMDPAGDFLITWSGESNGDSGWDVYAQRYSPTGLALGGAFRVNSTAAGDQMYSTAAMDPAGDFVITWSAWGQDGDGWDVYARRFTAAGLALGSEFLVNSGSDGDQMWSTAAMDGAGNFVITWSGEGGSGWDIYARRYAAAGLPLGSAFRVNTTAAGDQEWSTVAVQDNGDFVITWSGQGQDGNGWGVYGQQYKVDGTPAKTEFRINSFTAGDQEYSSVAVDPLGHAVVVWSGSGPGDAHGIFVQRYLLSVDDFSPSEGDAASPATDQSGEGSANLILAVSPLPPVNTPAAFHVASELPGAVPTQRTLDLATTPPSMASSFLCTRWAGLVGRASDVDKNPVEEAGIPESDRGEGSDESSPELQRARTSSATAPVGPGPAREALARRLRDAFFMDGSWETAAPSGAPSPLANEEIEHKSPAISPVQLSFLTVLASPPLLRTSSLSGTRACDRRTPRIRGSYSA